MTEGSARSGRPGAASAAPSARPSASGHLHAGPALPLPPAVRDAAPAGAMWASAAIAWIGSIATALLFAWLGAMIDGERPGAGPAVLLAAIAAACAGIGPWLSQRVGAEAERRLRQAVVGRVFQLGVARTAGRSGTLLSIATDAVERTAHYRGGFLGPILGALTTPLVVLGVMALTADAVTAGWLALLIVLVPVLIGGFRRLVRPIGGAYRRTQARLTAGFLEAIQALDTLVYARAAERVARDLARRGEEHRRGLMRMLAANQLLIFVVDAAFSLTVVVAATVIASLRAADGSISAGAAVAIVLMTVLVIGPVDVIGQFFYIGIGGRAAQQQIATHLGASSRDHGEGAFDSGRSATSAQAVSARFARSTSRAAHGASGSSTGGRAAPGAETGRASEASRDHAHGASTDRAARVTGSSTGGRAAPGAETGRASEASRDHAHGASTDRAARVTGSSTGGRVAPGAETGRASEASRDHAIVLDRVTAGYGGAPVLRDLSLRIEPGERVALVGPSGIGKSTVSALVQAHLVPSAGRVRVDGLDTAWADADAVRSRLAVVEQRPFLFLGTIAENLRMADPAASDERLWHALAVAGLRAEVERMPDGLDTLVGEHGALLSGGQAQRLAIARAALRDAPILLLDEPTSQVDLAGEAAILEALDRLAAGRTVLMIAHRPGAILAADRVIDLGAELRRARDGEANA